MQCGRKICKHFSASLRRRKEFKLYLIPQNANASPAHGNSEARAECTLRNSPPRHSPIHTNFNTSFCFPSLLVVLFFGLATTGASVEASSDTATGETGSLLTVTAEDAEGKDFFATSAFRERLCTLVDCKEMDDSEEGVSEIAAIVAMDGRVLGHNFTTWSLPRAGAKIR